MKKLVEIISDELNPKNDFDRVGYLEFYDKSKDGPSLRQIGHNIYFLVNSTKHIIRGGGIGAAIGFLGFYMGGGDPKVGAIVLGKAGFSIDFLQYMIEGGVIPMAKDTLKSLNRIYMTTKQAYLDTRNIFRKSSNGEVSN